MGDRAMNRHHLGTMRKTAHKVGLTKLLLEIANSPDPIGGANSARLVRALALLGEHGYSLPEGAQAPVKAVDGVRP